MGGKIDQDELSGGGEYARGTRPGVNVLHSTVRFSNLVETSPRKILRICDVRSEDQGHDVTRFG